MLALLAVLFTLHVAREFLIPVVLALGFALVLRPVVRQLRRLRLPEWLGAALVLGALLGGAGYGLVRLNEPALDWMERLPATLRRVEWKLRDLEGPVDKVSKAAEEVESITTPDDEPATQKVEVSGPGPRESLLSGIWDLAVGAAITIFLLYLLLATGDRLLERLAEFVFRSGRHRESVALMLRTERHVARYLGTISLINAALGVAVGASLWALGMPNPMLWGLLAAVANFVPYAGSFVAVMVLALASMLTFDEIGYAVLPPLAHASLSMLEGLLVTPLVLGRRFALHPVVLFVWLLFWGWIWGVVGALLAVPMLAALKIVAENVPRLAPLSRFLAR